MFYNRTSHIFQVKSGTLMIDPFVGTGSLLVACAAFGSMCMGSDIDPRAFKGQVKDHTVHSNFCQYGFKDRLLDLMVHDQAHPMYRIAELFDAVICDRTGIFHSIY